MDLKEAADLATALTLFVAAAAFCFSLYERSTRERDAEILRWQRVVVYEMIEAGVTSFSEIKLHYLAEAQQYPDFKIPNRDIQDGALKLVLLSLVEAKLISRTEEATWVVNVVSLQENNLKNFMFGEFAKRTSMSVLMSKIYAIADRESGKFTIDQLYRHLDAQVFGFTFEDFDVHLREMINRGVFVLDKEQRIWARNRVPEQQSRPQNPRQS